MKAVVVYYSATGSTAKIAKAIHRGLSGRMEVCDIFPVKRADPAAMGDYDLIVIGGPIWHLRDTVNLRWFLQNMVGVEGKLAVPFCCHGALPRAYFAHVSRALQHKGMTLIGWRDWYVNVQQVLHQPVPYFTDGHPDEIDLGDAEEFGRTMADHAIRIAAGDTDLIPALPRGPEADKLWKLFDKEFLEAVKAFHGGGEFPMHAIPNVRTVNKEKCIYPRCTACIDNCIVNLFDFSGPEPMVKKGCIGCDICDKICPVGAIDVDKATMGIRSNKVIHIDRCKHPECTVCTDNCPMDAIDFSVHPPAFTTNCEACDLCWAVCPHDALEITNMQECQGFMRIGGPDHPFAKNMQKAAEEGKFRWLIPLEKVGFDNILMESREVPRLVVKKEDDER
jgi:ferredoxin